MVGAAWGPGNKHSFVGTDIEVAASSFCVLWYRRISVTVRMSPRRHPTSLWLRSVATDHAECLSLRVRFPVPWDDSLDIAFEESGNYCASLSVTPRHGRFSLPGGLRHSILKPWSLLGRWAQVAEYTVSVIYNGDRYDFSGALVLPEPEATPNPL